MPSQVYTKITSKEVIGYMFQEMETATGNTWIPKISNEFTSSSASELYGGLGTVPQMREWIGGKQAKGFTEQSLRITNKDYESTIEINVKDLQRDKTAFLRGKIGELMRRAVTHTGKLLSTIIENGAGTTVAACYDGLALFSSTHSVGDSGTIDNTIDVDISAVPTGQHGSTTAPSIGEMAYAILAAVKQLMSFKDDQGEPINENASSFVVMVPVGLWDRAMLAAAVQTLAEGEANVLKAPGLSIDIQMNARLTWTDKFAVFRVDAPMKSLIVQIEEAEVFKAKAEGSDFEFDNKAHQYSVEKSGNVGCGRFDRTCLVTLI